MGMSIQDVAKKKRQNSQDVLEDIIYRWSPRSMNGEAMTEKELAPLFEAARWAPSNHNNQEWRFHYAHRDTPAFRDLFGLLGEFNQKWCEKAAILIILVSKKLSDHNDSMIRTHSFDTGAAWEALAIEATRRNLVVHGMAGFDYDKATKYLKLDDKEYAVECMIALGKPGEGVSGEDISDRKPTSEIAIKLG